jgi:hypothetical protein
MTPNELLPKFEDLLDGAKKVIAQADLEVQWRSAQCSRVAETVIELRAKVAELERELRVKDEALRLNIKARVMAEKLLGYSPIMNEQATTK